MKAAVIVFPASNCDRDVAVALAQVIGRPPAMIWHRETTLPPLDLIVLPGGFAFGDYLRVGAIAARSPVMAEVAARARAGVPVLGICNGFQVLTEAGLLPGALIRNRSLGFISRTVPVRVEATNSLFTRGYRHGQVVGLPIAHHDGNYRADPETLARLEGEGRVAFRYVDNPNGSAGDIAGILDERRTVLGLMPHPERAFDPVTGSTDGRAFFEGLVGTVAA